MSNHVFQRYEAKYLVDSRQRALLEQAFAGRMVPDFHDVEILNHAEIHPTSFSKYGMAYQAILMDAIHKNRGIRYA